MECISAIATPNGKGGVAIIRLSGANAFEIAGKMFSPSSKESALLPNHMYPGIISCDGFDDYGFMVKFASPKSFTGEDVVEFHCHGGVRIARGVLKKTFDLGARPAERGEFTRRAFLNGKLTLASAEGMADMINAESLALTRAGSMQYFGGLNKKVESIQDSLKDILAAIAVEIDYPEEDSNGLDMLKIQSGLEGVLGSLQSLINSYARGKRIKQGVTVAICGKPNAGKSSLLNALLGYDKAIVSDEAGTTRDIVEGSAEIEGVIYNFVDTAGLREHAGKVESMGIERAKQAIRSADITLFVREEDDLPPEDCGGTLITVFNKCDKKTPCGNYDIALSAKTGEGLPQLKKLLSRTAVGDLSADEAFVVDERHYDSLTQALKALRAVLENINLLTPDLLECDVREVWRILGEITGETAAEEIMDRVFSKFCVGK